LRSARCDEDDDHRGSWGAVAVTVAGRAVASLTKKRQ
jgi:hypothetical protein